MLTFALMFGGASAAMAGVLDSASVGITYTVDKVNSLEIEDPNMDFQITGGSAGSGSLSATATNYYSVTTNITGAKITARISGTGLDSGLTLWVDPDPPGVGTGIKTTLTTTDKNIVTGISQVSKTHNRMLFTLNADVNVTPQFGNNTIVFTLTD